MVICCVPQCGTNSSNCDSFITFHEFPSSLDIAVKWIKQINFAIKTKPMWVPRGKVFMCSKHFLQTDFKDNSDALKPRSVPTVFGHRYIGVNAEIPMPENKTIMNDPLIVKIISTQDDIIKNDNNIEISKVYSTVYESVTSDVRTQCGNQNSKIKETVINSKNLKTLLKPPLQTKNVSLNELTSPTILSNLFSQTKHLSTCTAPTSYQNASKSTQLENSIGVYDSTHTRAKKRPETTPRVYSRKKPKANNDLIEIGPNTFLKINPDVIKVNRKLTPSGNTVLQFLMDQKFANSHGSEIFPKVIQGPFTLPETNFSTGTTENNFPSNNQLHKSAFKSDIKKETKTYSYDSTEGKQVSNTVVQHVLGHLIDTHVCEESCTDLELHEEDLTLNENIIDENTKEDVLDCERIKNKQKALRPILPKIPQPSSSHTQNIEHSSPPSQNTQLSSALSQNTQSSSLDTQDTQLSFAQFENAESSTDNSVLENAPVLLTTNTPISHCFVDKPKFLLQLKKKNRQISALNFKISSLTKKIEELENKCIVQDRQLSYSFIKRLKIISKNATKGNPTATYILELIRGYSNNYNMRWSDSTLARCAVWVKKAPYAYEYFKKADLFKLPCLPTVRRFIKMHPELVEMQKKFNKKDGDTSSSDFNFDDESDIENQEKTALDENSIACESLLTEIPENKEQVNKNEAVSCTIANEEISQKSNLESISNSSNCNTVENIIESPEKKSETSTPITLDSSNLELQEIILPSGEVLQCYSSIISTGKDVGQYFIIPNANVPNSAGENEYSVVQADSLPAFLQNYVNSQQQTHDQGLVFVQNMDDQEKIIETILPNTIP